MLSPFNVLLAEARAWPRDRANHVLHLAVGGGRHHHCSPFNAPFPPAGRASHTGGWILFRPRLYRALIEARRRALGLSARPEDGFFPVYLARPACPATRSELNRAG